MKYLSLIYSLIFFCNFTLSQNINDDLLIHYSFDGNADDLSGNNFNGIVNATPAEDRFGNPNSAYSFNGINEFIDLPNHPDLKPQLPITISTWIKFNEIAGNQTTIFTNDFASDNHTGAWINTSSSGLFAANFGDNTGNTSSGNRRTKVGETYLQAGEWYYLTAVIRGINDMDLYIDCVNDGGTYNGSGGQMGYSNANGSIGRKDSYFNGPAWYFYGVIDEFKYWSRALSEEEITSLCRTADTEDILEINHSEHTAKLYPNPSNSVINIESDFKGDFDVSILTVEGKLINNFERNGNQIDVSILKNGVYFLNIKSRNNQKLNKTIRFIKN